MKFKIAEDIAQDMETVENKSTFQIEFHIYSIDRNNADADQYVAQLEQRLSAFGTENAEQKNESGKPYSLYRIVSRKFNTTQEIAQFFEKEFRDFINLSSQIWKMSNNFIRVVIVDESNPPKRIPGKTYTLLATSDYRDMLLELKGGA
jgi:hypothetical protein